MVNKELNKLYHKFRIYLPLLSIILIMSFIYSVYITQFVLTLINTQTSEYFLVAYSSQDPKQVGIVLGSILSFFVLMFTISLLRTSAMNPGYVQDPMQVEAKLLIKNLEFKHCQSDILHVQTNNHNHESSSEDDNSDMSLISEKRSKFLRAFSANIIEGPLTSTEFIQQRRLLEKYFNNDESNSTFNNLSSSSLANSGSSGFNETKLTMERNYNDVYENFKGIDFTRINVCMHCLRWKAERTHHCKQCGKCVLKMDHHCPWVGNCIGYKNYKFFCLLVIYGFLATLMVFFTFWETVVNLNMRFDSNLQNCVLVTFAYLVNFGMLIFVTYLFMLNWEFVFNNITCIEKADRDKFPAGKSFNCYDLGCFRNFLCVFGYNPLFWFLPINSNLKGDGIIFES